MTRNSSNITYLLYKLGSLFINELNFIIESNKASIVKVASETDFASRSSSFSDFVESVARAALESGNAEVGVTDRLDTGILLTCAVDDGGKTLKDALDDAILAIRENLSIGQATCFRAGKGSILAGYIHGKVSNVAGTSAAIVEIATTDSAPLSMNKEQMEKVGKRLAMHIVAAKPIYLSPNDIPKDIIQNEKNILLEQMSDSGKPPEILEKIVLGRLRKFYETVCLTEQSHMVEEGNPKVSKFLNKIGLKVHTFDSTSI